MSALLDPAPHVREGRLAADSNAVTTAHERKALPMSHVTEHLEEQGIDFEVLHHDHSPTAQAEAHALGVDADQVVKTVVLDVRTGHAFAVVPADRQVDLDAVKTAINSRHVALASEDDISRDYPEFELGAIPPLGALVRTPLIVDPAVLDHDTVVFATTLDESVRMSPRDLFDTCQMKVAPITIEHAPATA